VLARVLSVERRTGRHARGRSIFQDPGHRAFYADLFDRTAEKGRLRAFFASRDGSDLGFYVGFRFGAVFRGLQMGYADEAAALGVGTALHLHAIQAAASEGVGTYDLGMSMAYKERWAEGTLDLVSALVVPPHP
jgi:CelD/BcsL family acetyltransferase involved in cellulose biosynthesis